MQLQLLISLYLILTIIKDLEKDTTLLVVNLLQMLKHQLLHLYVEQHISLIKMILVILLTHFTLVQMQLLMVEIVDMKQVLYIVLTVIKLQITQPTHQDLMLLQHVVLVSRLLLMLLLPLITYVVLINIWVQQSMLIMELYHINGRRKITEQQVGIILLEQPVLHTQLMLLHKQIQMMNSVLVLHLMVRSLFYQLLLFSPLTSVLQHLVPSHLHKSLTTTKYSYGSKCNL